jgi:hypothetical protein
MTAIWLFLYLGTLMRLMTLYRLDFRRPATILLLLPILLMPVMEWLCRHQPWLLRKPTLQVAGILSVASALALAWILNLGFGDTTSTAHAALYALLGLSLSIVAQALPGECAGFGIWAWIAFWEFTGTWHPILTLLGAGLSGFLVAFGNWPERRRLDPAPSPTHAFWAALLLGLVLPKPGFDFQFTGTWPSALAVFALGVGVAGLASLRTHLDRLPNALPYLLLGLAFVAYPSAWVHAWALAVGLLWGILWPRLPQPISRLRLSLGFITGVLVSYSLHSNLGIPFLRRLLWWGS